MKDFRFTEKISVKKAYKVKVIHRKYSILVQMFNTQ